MTWTSSTAWTITGYSAERANVNGDPDVIAMVCGFQSVGWNTLTSGFKEVQSREDECIQQAENVYQYCYKRVLGGSFQLKFEFNSGECGSRLFRIPW